VLASVRVCVHVSLTQQMQMRHRMFVTNSSKISNKPENGILRYLVFMIAHEKHLYFPILQYSHASSISSIIVELLFINICVPIHFTKYNYEKNGFDV